MAKKGNNKVLDSRTAFIDFDGKPIKWQEKPGQKEEDQPDATLKLVLLRYVANANTSDAKLSDEEKVHAYEAGRIIGMAGGKFELIQQQYDVMKKIVDSGKIEIQGKVVDLLNLVVHQQAKNIINDAKTV